MAVVRIDKDGKRIHHRNPSGFINKIRYLLDESKRDMDKLRHIVRYEIDYTRCGKATWDHAYSMAWKLIINGDTL